jgi:hypothetical protein
LSARTRTASDRSIQGKGSLRSQPSADGAGGGEQAGAEKDEAAGFGGGGVAGGVGVEDGGEDAAGVLGDGEGRCGGSGGGIGGVDEEAAAGVGEVEGAIVLDVVGSRREIDEAGNGEDAVVEGVIGADAAGAQDGVATGLQELEDRLVGGGDEVEAEDALGGKAGREGIGRGGAWGGGGKRVGGGVGEEVDVDHRERVGKG